MDHACGNGTMNHLVCFGFGYSAAQLATELDASRWTITGTARSSESAAAITAQGHSGIIFDADDPKPTAAALEAAIDRATHIVLSIPPNDGGDPVLAAFADQIARAPNLQTICYLSTIGVYGNHDGAWVDETTPSTPGSTRSKRRVTAEQQWQDFAAAHTKRLQIFRLAGIYGPGRSAIDALKAGRARRITKPGQVFNRIHVADIAGAVARGLDGAGTHTIYNVTDDEPAPPQDVVTYAAMLLGITPPPEVPFAEAGLSAMGRSFYAEIKRVRNDRLKTDLGYTLRYPTYREGLKASL